MAMVRIPCLLVLVLSGAAWAAVNVKTADTTT